MEHDCKYVVNHEGNVQLHPKTGESLQDCKITKSDYVVAMETIGRVVDQITSETKPNTEDSKVCK